MLLKNLFEDESREDKDVDKAPPPGITGDKITTAQAAKILDVTMSRVRQMIADGDLKDYGPEKGRRDNLVSKSEVDSINAKRKEKRKKDNKDKD